MSSRIRQDGRRLYTALIKQFREKSSSGEQAEINPFIRHIAPGHFYSPLPDLAEVHNDSDRIWGADSLAGISTNLDHQLALLETLSVNAGEFAFPAKPSKAFRYHYQNKFFPRTDGFVYFLLLLHLQPCRVIEIGSGYSSALLFDTCQSHIGNDTVCTFIEPDARRLRRLLRGAEVDAHLIESRLQDVDHAIFRELGPGDVLFVDSSHVAKVGSDVNDIFFQVLPMLREGVYVHFHDIYYPFEYPHGWIEMGRAWNEAYLLRAFLLFNSSFEIVLWNRQMTTDHHQSLPANLREVMLPLTGGSFWVKRK